MCRGYFSTIVLAWKEPWEVKMLNVFTACKLTSRYVSAVSVSWIAVW